MNKIQNHINHVVFVIDRSGSMKILEDGVVKVFDEQVAYLSRKSQEMNQETRVSIYLFNHEIECLVYDMDVMRLPSLKHHYIARGDTALVAATIKATEDLKKTPEIYADHAFLVYVLTDGYENASFGGLYGHNCTIRQINSIIDGAAANWTFACFVPNERSRDSAVSYGFCRENTQIWSTTSAGMLETGETIKKATERFMTLRSQGVRGTKNLFSLDASNLNSATVKSILVELKPGIHYSIFPVHKDSVIKPFVESWTQKPYCPGAAYFQLTKPEKIQNYKQICVQEKSTGKVYGGADARGLLGFPDYEVKVEASMHPKYNIYIQSTSLNRKLIAGTQLIVLL